MINKTMISYKLWIGLLKFNALPANSNYFSLPLVVWVSGVLLCQVSDRKISEVNLAQWSSIKFSSDPKVLSSLYSRAPSPNKWRSIKQWRHQTIVKGEVRVKTIWGQIKAQNKKACTMHENVKMERGHSFVAKELWSLMYHKCKGK